MDTPLLVLVAGIAFVGLCLGAVIATVLSRRSNAIQIRMLEENMGAQQFALDEQAAKLAGAISQRDGAKGLVVEHAQELAVVKERLLMQNQTLSETQASLASSEQKNRELNDALARQESAYTHLQTSTAEQIALLSDAKKQLTEQFEQLANRIFDEKSQRFQVHSRDALEGAGKLGRGNLRACARRVRATQRP